MTAGRSGNFEESGFELCPGLIRKESIHRFKAAMARVMAQFCTGEQKDLDRQFAEITDQGKVLRGNVLKLFSRMASLPLMLGESRVADRVKELGFEVPVIQAYSVVCMEPGEKRFLFLPHQDLKDRVNQKAMILWIPLSRSDDEGGIGVYPGSHREGPIKHELSNEGHLRLSEKACEAFAKREITKFEEGDCLLMSPYLIHWSVGTRGSRIRWTAIVKIDEGLATPHLRERLNPFVISDYIDERSNEQRLAASGGYRAG